MKKIYKTLVAASVLLCGLVFTGCEFYKQAVVDNTQGQWYKFNKTYDIPLAAAADEDTEKGTLKDATVYVYYTSDDGLKVAVQAESTEKVELMGGLFEQDVELTTGAVYTFEKEQFGDGKWTALVKLSTMMPADEPKVSSDPDKCIILGGDNAKETKVMWKKVLANIILNKLLAE